MLERLAKTKRFSWLVALAAGLYPFLHYYNSNFDMADSWVQFLFLFSISFVLPLILICISPLVFKISFLRRFEKYRLAAINFAVFAGLISLLVFLSNKKVLVLTIFLAALLSFLLYKHLVKIIVLQLLLALLSSISLLPRLWFMANYSTSWTQIDNSLAEVNFVKTPNIYVIQPDGYTNFSELRKPPYNHLDTGFEIWLRQNNFVNYEGFRSNYNSTVTSNSSMFAMKHHYLQNTFKGNLKTFGAQEVIVGDYNNVLKILKRNNYKTYLITDNSYFIINRKNTLFDYCNIDQKDVKLYDTGPIAEADIIPDLNAVIQDASSTNNFYFIEKTIPSHIAYSKSYSLGVEGERLAYLERLETANTWVIDLIDVISKYDNNAMIIIVADHGGSVGLSYVKEIENKELTETETISVFSSLLSIKWPNNEVPDSLSFKSNVNLFRNIFSYLSDDKSLLNNLEPDKSFRPKYDGWSANYYECITEDYKVVFDVIEENKK
ncbi:sulfatase-like protein [Ulvibacter sp. MAR_2010_11]|uniref:sulfatase-like hydrolase/transferase n=1 Tax=Ulvibacter sp. MAR_2010_11 TaxID=1250229 RepID=UPI000C2CD74F|nr:sulfatase-like hydrolase/transferase [Ulvibacter sp. MAR_2010_11]PKA83617.1 sulfatase-like protein [Ulvibacter sp. MAR_2010_11]